MMENPSSTLETKVLLVHQCLSTAIANLLVTENVKSGDSLFNICERHW